MAKVEIKKRDRTYHHTVDVDVDVSLRFLSSEDLIDELEERGDWRDPTTEHNELLESILEQLRRGDIAEAMLLVERALSPKWPDENAALEEYKKLMGRVPGEVA